MSNRSNCSLCLTELEGFDAIFEVVNFRKQRYLKSCARSSLPQTVPIVSALSERVQKIRCDEANQMPPWSLSDWRKLEFMKEVPAVLLFRLSFLLQGSTREVPLNNGHRSQFVLEEIIKGDNKLNVISKI